MTEHLTQNQLANYNQRKLSSAELLSVADHLGTCEACRRQLETALEADAAFLAVHAQVFGEAEEMASPAAVQVHPTVEATADFVDGTLSREEMQAVTDHLSRCPQCSASVNELRAFKKEVAPGLNREYRPAIGQRFILSIFSRSPVLAYGSAVAVLLLLSAGWVIWQRLQENTTKQVSSREVPAPATVSPGPVSVIAELNDGARRLVLDQEGKLSGADDLPSDYQLMLKDALTRRQLEKSPLLAGLTRPVSTLMSGNQQANEFSVLDPVGKVVIADRPAFRWSRLDGATGYVVEVYDEKFNRVAASPQSTSTSWIPSQRFRRGEVYSWQVKAVKDGQEFSSPRPPAPEAKFRVLDQERANELAEVQRAHASSHLMLGLLCVRFGLLDEAEREFRTSQEANPNSPIVPQLLENVQAMRR